METSVTLTPDELTCMSHHDAFIDMRVICCAQSDTDIFVLRCLLFFNPYLGKKQVFSSNKTMIISFRNFTSQRAKYSYQPRVDSNFSLKY